MADLTSAAQSASRSVGRYFSIVSTLPSVLLVAWLFLLNGSGAFRGLPDVRGAVDAVGSLSLGAAGGLAAAALALGVVLHPLQFAFVQVLEGYWGVSPVAQRWRVTRILAQHRRTQWLRETESVVADRLERHADGLLDADAETRAAWFSERDETIRLFRSRPAALRETMPTRLGNALRHHETAAGAPFGLEAISAMPYLARVAPAGDMDYVDDQRSQLDLAVRTMIVSSIAFVATAVPLLTDGLWLLTALIPYGAVYLSYRGAVVAADEYGRALAVVVALNRFTLYEQLRIPLPTTADEERQQNERVVNEMLDQSEGVRTTYTAAPDPRPGSAGSGPGG